MQQLLLVFLAIHFPIVASQGTYISIELPFHYSLTDTGSISWMCNEIVYYIINKLFI